MVTVPVESVVDVRGCGSVVRIEEVSFLPSSRDRQEALPASVAIRDMTVIVVLAIRHLTLS